MYASLCPRNAPKELKRKMKSCSTGLKALLGVGGEGIGDMYICTALLETLGILSKKVDKWKEV